LFQYFLDSGLVWYEYLNQTCEGLAFPFAKTQVLGCIMKTVNLLPSVDLVGLSLPAVVCALMLSGSAIQAQTFVFGKAGIGLAAKPNYVAQGDFNGDGVLDFAVSNTGANTVSIILSKANGAYEPKVDYTVSSPGQIAVGDFNNDGKLDIAVAGGATLSVLLGVGDGTFQAPISQSISATSLATADFNKDGKLDLFITSSASSVYFGNGDGTFTSANSGLGSYGSVSITDFNQDGKLDVLLSNALGATTYLGNGAGGFAEGILISNSGTSYATVGDFNGDGNPDFALAATTCGGRTGCHTFLFSYLGAGDGLTFTQSASIGLVGTTPQLVVADFNQDGKQDVFALGSGVVLGNGNGTFQSLASVPTAITPVWAVIGDFNNDGQLDIGGLDSSGFLSLNLGNHGSFAGTTAASVSSYLGPETIFADVNGDGKPDEISFGTFPTQGLIVQLGNGDGTFQAPQLTSTSGNGNAFYAVAVGDFNNDGKLDVAAAGSTGSIDTLAVFLGNGDGTFTPPVFTTSNMYTLGLAVADMNGDGKLDIVSPVQNGANGLNVYLGNGDGTFKVPTTTYATCSSFAIDNIVLADFNHDGKIDAATGCGALEVLLGNGDGTLQPAVPYGSGGGGWVVAGDFNGDGIVDIAQPPVTFLGNGDGTFQFISTPMVSGTIEGLTAGDFNNDGKTDLALLLYPTSLSLERLFFSNGDGTFTPSFLLSAPGAGLAVADLNGDGASDLFAVTPAATSSTFTTLNPPVLSFAPGELLFPNQAVGITSSALTLTVVNNGVAPVTIGAAGVSGDFALASNNCPATLAEAAACQIGITFTPSALGVRTGVVTLASNQLGGTAILALTGNGAVSGAAVQVSPSSITFPGQQVGTTSPAQIVTVTSSGAGSLTFSGFTTSGDFAQTNNCPAVLNSGASCLIYVTFTPTATLTRTGTLVISDNAAGGSQTVSLTGTGLAPAVSLSPTSLVFPTQLIDSTNTTEFVTLSNTGTAPLTITKVSITGTNASAFTQTNNCGTTVVVGGACTISVTFQANAINTLTATLSITDNAAGSLQTVALSGTGTEIKLAPASLSFGSITVGKKSAVKKVTMSNQGDTSASITSISITGTNKSDFTESSTCKSSLAAGKNCTISVTFAPTAKGSRSASLSIADNGGASPQTVALSGTGK
jgi:hypothetical protein